MANSSTTQDSPETEAKLAARKLLTEHCGNMIHALEDGISSRSASRGSASIHHEAARLKILLNLFNDNDSRIAEIIHQTIH